MTLTKKQNELIADNLRAYIANFGYIRIERADYGKGFYIYTENSVDAVYTHYCYNIDYVNGWLYGAVQAVNKRMKPLEKDEF